MRRLLLFLILATAIFGAANLRLYLKDGDYQSVREYKVDGDRVRYFSTDRGEWEEVPLELVDLKKTETDAAARAVAMAETVRTERAEDDAIKADKKQVASVPEMPGVYLIEGDKLTPLAEASTLRKDSTTQKILQAIAPAPIVASKSTIFIEGKAAKIRITNLAPEFFFRLAMQERLALVKLESKKDQRVIENVTIMPGGDEIFEEQKQMPTFKKQYGYDLYRLWPEQTLEPGEYAVIEYTDGQIMIRAWDFAIDKAAIDKTK